MDSFSNSRRGIATLLLWSGVVALAVGFIVHRSWLDLPWQRAGESLLLALIALSIGAGIRLVRGGSIVDAVALVWLLALVWFAGVVASAAVLLFAIAAFAIGDLVVAKSHASLPLRVVAGIAMIAGALGWLLPFAVHHRLVYLAALVLVIASRRGALLDHARSAMSSWRAAVDCEPALALLAITAIGLASTGAWLPTVQFDDLSYHVALPWQLSTLAYYRLDVQTQIWALAPWAGDVVQAVPHVIAGREARSAVDALWVVLIGGLSWQLGAALRMPPWSCWLGTALVASLPLLASLAGGMQAELPASAVLLALMLAISVASAPPEPRTVFVVALTGGLLLGLKTGYLPAVILAAGWLRSHGRIPGRVVLAAFALALVVAGSSYAYAYALTGNPLSPLLNDVFQSPLLPRDIGDPRWTAGGGLAMPWRMVFATGDYVEGWNGAAGFTLIGLAGAAVAALAMPPLRAVAAIAIIAIVAPIATVNYFRYAFPALVLLTPVMVAATVALASRRTATTLLVAMVVLDLSFQANSFWTLHIGWVRRMVVLPTTESIYERLAPERVISSDLRRDDPEAVVVFAARSAPFAAELAGRAFTTAWYDPELHAASTRAETDPTGNGWRNLFARTGARYVVTTTVARSAALTASLADASRVRQVRAAELWRLPTPGHSKLVVERDLAARMRR